MAIDPDFPTSPYEVLNPNKRWFPADEALREHGYEKLLPPLVANLRKEVKKWRDNHYQGAHETSRALLRWWFETEHPIPQNDGTTAMFQYYFAQREALETVIYLHDVMNFQNGYDLMRFDSSGAISASMFQETWRRLLVKMATGSGKTKVMSLVLAWCYFHKLYEPNSDLARNFLLIAPNIIVLDRLRADFDGLRIFSSDPVLPENGYEGRNWRDDFQLNLHIQDEVNVVNPVGNIFLTNIHRVYQGSNIEPSADDEDTADYFLGKKPTGKTTDSKIDLGDIVRDIDELIVINDEAHHIHNDKLAWFKSIEDIHHKLVQKEKSIALQIDVTATPKHNNGSIFVQTISDYPLVEAIAQNVVKKPVIPDRASRGKLNETQSSSFTEKYADYIKLGVIEWRKAYDEHKKLDKKAVLFIMTDDTKNCDDVAEYLKRSFPEFEDDDSVFVIHTKKNGEISESSTDKDTKELQKLRKQANEIDNLDNPAKAIISVLMLKEGWDVRNVTTIVGLRAYTAKSNILPEQTLGRGLRRMYPDRAANEKVSVIGTNAFMEFVESIRNEGVTLEESEMGTGSNPKTPLIIEVDRDNPNKDFDLLDIKIPVLTPRIGREYKNLSELSLDALEFSPVTYKEFTVEEQREIIFQHITNEEFSHKTEFNGNEHIAYQNVIGYFTRTIMKELKLFAHYDPLYGFVKEFIQHRLFGKEVDLESANTIRNLSNFDATQIIIETFKNALNALTIHDSGKTTIKDTIELHQTRPFVVKDQGFILPGKSIFNKIVGDNILELNFARFLDNCSDIIAYTKNYFALGFKIDYVKSDGNISNYFPDFIVKKSITEIVIVETKGRQDLDDPRKLARLKQWCDDVNELSTDISYSFVFVDQSNFEQYPPNSFGDLIDRFREYQ
jgi:type III restriction enzyme